MIFTKKDDAFEAETKRVLAYIGKLQPDTKEYEAAVKNLDTLRQMGTKNRLVSGDTIAMCITNILGIALVLNYESLHVVSSKAISFVLKGRI